MASVTGCASSPLILLIDRARKAGARITFSDIMVHGGDLGVYYHRSGEKTLGDLYVSLSETPC